MVFPLTVPGRLLSCCTSYFVHLWFRVWRFSCPCLFLVSLPFGASGEGGGGGGAAEVSVFPGCCTFWMSSLAFLCWFLISSMNIIGQRFRTYDVIQLAVSTKQGTVTILPNTPTPSTSPVQYQRTLNYACGFLRPF